MSQENQQIRKTQRGEKRPASSASEENDLLLKDSRFAEATWDPRFSRVPKRAKGGIDDERFNVKLKKDPSFREKFTPVDRFGRPKKLPTLHNSLRRLTANDDEHSSEDSAADEDIERDAVFSYDADPTSEDMEDMDDESDLEDFVEDVEELENIPRGNATKRLAVIGLDWSITRAVDILASLGSFCPTGKRIVSAEVHPSKFGLKRLAIEAKFGPQVIGEEDLKVISQAKNVASISVKEEGIHDTKEGCHADDLIRQEKEREETSNNQMYNSENSQCSNDENDRINSGDEEMREDQAALRRYEEERLNYYYGVVEFEDVKSANAVYEQCDGVEYFQSGRDFDLRFIPDDMKIETTPRDRAESIPDGYSPPNIDTSSLNSSKVKLSWDADDPERMVLKTKAFTQHELNEDDLKAYLASSSDEENEQQSHEDIKKKRSLLLGATESLEENPIEIDDVDLEVSFEPGMLEKGEEILNRKKEKDELQGETQWEARLRRMREQKNEKRRRRRELLASRESGLGNSSASDHDDPASMDNDPNFSDPFFCAERDVGANKGNDIDLKRKSKSKFDSKVRKETNGQVSEETKDNEHHRREQANLELLTMDIEGNQTGSAKLREVLAAADSDDEEGHKRKNGKRTRGKRRWQKQKDVTTTKPSVMDTEDTRFQGLFNSHLFAIDPTHPKYRDNDTTRSIMKEKGCRTRKQEMSGSTPNLERTTNLKKEGAGSAENANAELRQLAARVKARAQARGKRSTKV